MKSTVVLLAIPIILVACAELDSEPESTRAFEQTITITADDGTEFEASIVHDGIFTPEQGLELLGSIEIVSVGVTPVEAELQPSIVSAVEAQWDPRPNTDVSIYVTGIDSDTLLGNYRWGWIEELEQEDLEAFIDDACPPWH